MRVIYQIIVEIDDEECPREQMHEDVIQHALDAHIGIFCARGAIRVLHATKVSERDS